MATQISVGMKKAFRLTGFVDAAGNPTSLDPTTPVTELVSADNAIAEVVDYDPATDPFMAKCAMRSAGVVVQIRAVVDVDRGDGVKPLTIIGEVEGIAGEAVTGNFSFEGTEEPA